MLGINAAEMYKVLYSPIDEYGPFYTLAFYYDDLKETREGTVYSIDDNISENLEDITYAYFDESFSEARPTSTLGWFCGMSSLEYIDCLHFLNTSEVTNMAFMFAGCFQLWEVILDSFDTSKVTDMSYMFYMCRDLIELDLKNFNTQNVTNMSNMFTGCWSLQSLDVSHFDTHNVTDMTAMFSECCDLKSLDVSNFDTHNVTDMTMMFYVNEINSSYIETLDVSNFNTKKVKSMYWMFSGLDSLTELDLRNFEISPECLRYGILEGCSKLKSLYVPSSFTILTQEKSLSYNYGDEFKGVGTAISPCALYAPKGFYFGSDINTSSDYFEWQGGFFYLPVTEWLYVEPITLYGNSSSTLAIELKNTSSEQFVGYQFNLKLPEGVSLNKDNNGKYIYKLGSRNEDMITTIKQQADGSYNLICFGLSNTPISGNEGVILYLDVVSDNNLEDESYEGTISAIRFGNYEGSDIFLKDTKFTIYTSRFDLGDVNHDGIVSISDITMTINHILGNASNAFNANHADLNGDGIINVADVIQIVEIILNSDFSNRQRNLIQSTGLSMKTIGSDCYLYLSNASRYKACQFLIHVADGRIQEANISNGTLSDHKIIYKKVGNGLYKVIVFSLDGQDFEETSDALIRFHLKDSNQVKFTNIRFTDQNFCEHSFNDINSETTEINNVLTEDTNAPIYDLNGHKVSIPSTNGIYISKGKKVVVNL